MSLCKVFQRRILGTSQWQETSEENFEKWLSENYPDDSESRRIEVVEEGKVIKSDYTVWRCLAVEVKDAT